LSYIHDRHWQECGTSISTDGRLPSCTRAAEQQSHDELGDHDPRCDPANLMVSVIDVQVGGIDVVYGSKQDAEAVQDKEQGLH